MKLKKLMSNVWVFLVAGLLIGGVLTFYIFPREVEKIVYKDKIVTVDKIVEKPVDKIVYKDKIVIKEVVSNKLTCVKGSIPAPSNWVGSQKVSECAKAHNRSAC